jgi:hypothetical protein
MVNIGSFVKRAVPTIIAGATGGPVAAIGTIAAQDQAIKAQKRRNKEQREFENMMRNPQQGSYFQDLNTANAAKPGFFDPGGTLQNIGTSVSGFFESVGPVFDFFTSRNTMRNMPPAGAISITNAPPQETAQSGEITGANLGALVPLGNAVSTALRSPAGSAALGAAGGLLASGIMDGANGKPRITRKMKADVRKIYMMSGMDPNATAQILNNLGTYPRINFSPDLIFFILTKRFRNDGPVVTKAAVRKTRSTLRKMKNVVDMYNSVCKPTTRRAPARRSMAKSSTTLIKN